MEQEVTDSRVVKHADRATAANGALTDHETWNGGSSTAHSYASTAAMGRLLRAFAQQAPLDDQLREAARSIVRDARRRGLTAAQMIVAARSAWMRLDELRPLIPDDDVRALASRMISCAIEEFYAAPAERRDGRDGAEMQTRG